MGELVLGKLVGTDQLERNAEKRRHRKGPSSDAVSRQDNNLDLTSYTEDVIEGTVTVTMDQTWSNKVSISALDRTLSFDRYSEMVLKPQARRAAERIEASIAALYPNFYWFSGTPGTVPSTFAALAGAGAIFSDAGNALGGRVAVHSPEATALLAGTIAATNVQGNNKVALEKAMIGNFAGFDNYQSVFAPTHTVGVATGTPLVNGASQSVTYATAKDSWSQSLIGRLDQLDDWHPEGWRRVHHCGCQRRQPRHQGQHGPLADVHGFGGCRLRRNHWPRNSDHLAAHHHLGRVPDCHG
jgi:hypothetical protein